MLHLIKCFCPKHLIKNSLQFEWVAVFFFLNVAAIWSTCGFVFPNFNIHAIFAILKKICGYEFFIKPILHRLFVYCIHQFFDYHLHAKHAYSYSLYDSSGMSLSCVLCTSTYYTHFFHLFLVYCSSVLYTYMYYWL